MIQRQDNKSGAVQGF